MAILRVREPFAVDWRGVHRVLRAGDLLDENDPIIKGREAFFEAVEVASSRDAARVEQASAAPGELRRVTTPRPRGAARGSRSPK